MKNHLLTDRSFNSLNRYFNRIVLLEVIIAEQDLAYALFRLCFCEAT